MAKSSVSAPAFTFPPRGFHKSASGLVEISVGTFPIPSQRTGTKWKEQNWCTLQKAGRGGNYWSFCLCCESWMVWSIAASQVSWVVHFENFVPISIISQVRKIFLPCACSQSFRCKEFSKGTRWQSAMRTWNGDLIWTCSCAKEAPWGQIHHCFTLQILVGLLLAPSPPLWTV